MRRYLLLAAALLAITAIALPQPGGSAQAADGPLAGLTICLDPGHGGTDPGAINGALQEKEINLDVSLALADLLQADGAAVVMTRTGDATLSNRDRYTFCNNAGADLLVSVHTNSTTSPEADGSLAIYFDPQDHVLAQALQTSMFSRLSATAPSDTFTDYGLKKDALGVLLKSDMPSAMAEPVMMSNPAEAAALAPTIAEGCGADLATCRRGEIALSIEAGVLDYVASLGNGSGGGGGDTGGGPSCGAPPCGKKR
jgi:N-acetylmuramoyl-L-alanine amidase